MLVYIYGCKDSEKNYKYFLPPNTRLTRNRVIEICSFSSSDSVINHTCFPFRCFKILTRSFDHMPIKLHIIMLYGFFIISRPNPARWFHYRKVKQTKENKDVRKCFMDIFFPSHSQVSFNVFCMLFSYCFLRGIWRNGIYVDAKEEEGEEKWFWGQFKCRWESVDEEKNSKKKAWGVGTCNNAIADGGKQNKEIESFV